MKPKLALLLLACLALAACASPEATRRRSGGPGSDPGNRPANVRMHEGSDQYWKTPDRIGVQHPSLDAAQQARRLDLR